MNWKTTVGGMLMAIGQGLTVMGGNWVYVGNIVTGIGGLLLGITAMDATKPVKPVEVIEQETGDVIFDTQPAVVSAPVQIPGVEPFQYPVKPISIKDVVKDAAIDAGTTMADRILHDVASKLKNKGSFDV